MLRLQKYSLTCHFRSSLVQIYNPSGIYFCVTCKGGIYFFVSCEVGIQFQFFQNDLTTVQKSFTGTVPEGPQDLSPYLSLDKTATVARSNPMVLVFLALATCALASHAKHKFPWPFTEPCVSSPGHRPPLSLPHQRAYQYEHGEDSCQQGMDLNLLQFIYNNEINWSQSLVLWFVFGSKFFSSPFLPDCDLPLCLRHWSKREKWFRHRVCLAPFSMGLSALERCPGKPSGNLNVPEGLGALFPLNSGCLKD